MQLLLRVVTSIFSDLPAFFLLCRSRCSPLSPSALLNFRRKLPQSGFVGAASLFSFLLLTFFLFKSSTFFRTLVHYFFYLAFLFGQTRPEELSAGGRPNLKKFAQYPPFPRSRVVSLLTGSGSCSWPNVPFPYSLLEKGHPFIPATVLTS